jgi:4-hydroxy-tetrahydrodipicolinate synthase
MSALPRGTYVPVVTPFTDAGEVDYAALDRLLQRLLAADVEALVMLGTTGENPTVTGSEFTAIIERTLEQTRGKAAVLAGVGTNDTRTSVAQARTAAALGVQGLLVVCPYYNKPTQSGIQTHYETIADTVPVPQLVYNIAGRTGVNIETGTLLALSAHPNIVGVKEASNDIDQIGEVLHQAPSDFLVLSGCDHLNYPLMCLGGQGVISTLANIVPGEVKALVDAALVGEYERARDLHFHLLPLAYGCFMEANPIPVKTALALMGDMQESFRPPMAAMQPDTRERWQTMLTEYGLLTAASSDGVAA